MYGHNAVGPLVCYVITIESTATNFETGCGPYFLLFFFGFQVVIALAVQQLVVERQLLLPCQLYRNFLKIHLECLLLLLLPLGLSTPLLSLSIIF